ncbi:MAG: AI-2E family transporter, partial [Desulfobacterales bacterium]|nr:AI-2E family transporter [Desulfobacterales bacterium]
IICLALLSKEAYGVYLMGKDAASGEQLKNFLQTNRLIEKGIQLAKNLHLNINAQQIYDGIAEIGKTIGFFIFKQSSAIVSNLFQFFVNFFFMLLIVFFLLVDGPSLVSFIIDISPLPKEEDEKLIQKFKDMVGAMIVGNGAAGLIQGIGGGTLFALFGLDSPFLWGVVMVFLAFLPLIGIGLIFVPAIIYLFLNDRVISAVFFIISYVVLSIGSENILKPKLIGDRVQMHTLLVFLSIIGGLKLFGIAGIIYGPLVVTAFLTLTDIYQANYQKIVEPE